MHYPIPLTYLAEPDIGTLRKTFERMQSQANFMYNSRAFSEMPAYPQSNNSLDDFANMESENFRMRQEISELERVFS